MSVSHRALSLALALLLAAAGTVEARQGSLRVGPSSLYPDPTLTPGATFDGVTADQVCAREYSRSVRDVTAGERAEVYAEYGMTDVRGADEVDHFIPLELGGSNDLSNLWPEPFQPAPGAHEKDRVENYLHEQVCNGALGLVDAQQMILSDWYAVYVGLVTLTPVPAPTPSATQDTSVSDSAVAPVTNSQEVVFANVTGGPPGGRASVTVQTAPGAVCSVQYVTPAGSKSTAQGQGAGAPLIVGDDGTASWSWAIGPSTTPGSGSVTATCSTGTATAGIAIG